VNQTDIHEVFSGVGPVAHMPAGRIRYSSCAGGMLAVSGFRL